MASHKGRHRRPSRAVKAAKIIAPGVASGALMVLAANGAQAQVIPAVPRTVPSITVQDFVRTYVPQHAAEEVTIHPGDNLSSLAGKYCGNPKDWTGWWNYNHKTLKWSDPNVIYAGQHAHPDCKEERVWLPHPVVTTAAVQGSGNKVITAYAAPQSSGGGNVNPGNYSGYQQCVITRESGGDSQVMNSSGHYGLYQFDEGTWASGGGNPGDFGHASVEEQNRVFQAVYAARGTQPWSPSDGC